MIWLTEEAKYEHWTPWFAWHPVTIGTHWVWLEKVERKGAWYHAGGMGAWLWEYR